MQANADGAKKKCWFIESLNQSYKGGETDSRLNAARHDSWDISISLSIDFLLQK